MSWNLRLQQMIMAGGVFSFSACNGGHGRGLQTGQNSDAQAESPFPVVGIPCGNASPDPCICGREGVGPDALQMCQACWANNGQWQAATLTDSQRCIGGADAAATDTSEAATDGAGGSDAASADAAGTDAAGGASGAGGGDAAGGTGGTPWTIPCGNANPDPCICGRAGSSPDAEQVCRDCQTTGGQWHAATGAQLGQCVGGHDAGTSDADAGDGNTSHG